MLPALVTSTESDVDEPVTEQNDIHRFAQPPSPTATNEDNSASSHTITE